MPIKEGQPLAFTYEVTFEESDIKWPSRWDAYLKMEGAKVHWFSILNSLMVITFLAGIVLVIFLRTVRRDLASYEELDKEAQAQMNEELSGWKLVVGDVFRAPSKLPRCDICQDKTAFIFCVEDRALFCEDCDKSIHLPGSLSANHQRFLATGIQVAMKSNCAKDDEQTHLEPPKRNTHQVSLETPSQQVPDFTPPWGVDDLLELADFNSHDKKDSMQFGEMEWFTEEGLFGDDFTQEAMAAAEVPQLPVTHASNHYSSHRNSKSHMSNKKPRIELIRDYDYDDEDEYFTVPDLG